MAFENIEIKDSKEHKANQDKSPYPYNDWRMSCKVWELSFTEFDTDESLSAQDGDGQPSHRAYLLCVFTCEVRMKL